MKYRTMANIITICRIILSVFMLLFSAFSPTFYGLYILAGFTDMIDGAIARKSNTVSEFGSKLDTIADFIFVVVCMIKLLPILNIPLFIWILICTVAVIKVVNVILGYAVYKEFVAMHTLMNKITGLLLFLLPLTLNFIELKYSGSIVCVVAAFAALQEGYYIKSVIYNKNK